jgi:hypothetical protein
MKLSGVFILTILAGLFVTGCKEKAAKDLIVKKWNFTDITGPDAAEIPDSMKKEMYKTATMEFKKDGTWEAGGMRTEVQKCTYSLSEDGNSIITIEGSGTPDTLMILELTETKMVITPKNKERGDNIQLTMKAN